MLLRDLRFWVTIAMCEKTDFLEKNRERVHTYLSASGFFGMPLPRQFFDP